MVEIVREGKIEIDYSIRELHVDGVIRYDWVLSNGDGSDEWYESADEAEEVVKGWFR